MSTQVQHRGAAQATQEARTLVAREIDFNTTDWRMCVHNGTTAGGVPHANCFDVQNQEWTYAAASGTNTITATYAKAPAAYQAGQKFSFKAANTNSGSATLNVNSLGAKTIKKVSNGALTTLASGDIVSGVIYEVTYDGTDMLLGAGSGGGGAGWELIEEVAMSGTNLHVTALDGKAYKSAHIEFENMDCAGTNFMRLWQNTEVTTNVYFSKIVSITGVATSNLQGTYAASAAQGEFQVNGIANDYITGHLWIHNLRGIYPFMRGLFTDDNRVWWEWHGVMNVNTGGAITDFQIGRTASSNYSANSFYRVYGHF